jgi:preprotein translocase subunit SecG
MATVLLVVHVLIALALVIVVLLQRSEGGGLGIGSSSGGLGGFMTARGTANLLTRTTAILAGAFMLMSLILAILASAPRDRAGMRITPDQLPAAPAGTPATPQGPAAPIAR